MHDTTQRSRNNTQNHEHAFIKLKQLHTVGDSVRKCSQVNSRVAHVATMKRTTSRMSGETTEGRGTKRTVKVEKVRAG